MSWGRAILIAAKWWAVSLALMGAYAAAIIYSPHMICVLFVLWAFAATVWAVKQ